MFTGIIEETGNIREITATSGRSGHIKIDAKLVSSDIEIGDSVSISGVCQTVVAIEGKTFTVEVMPETVRKTTLGSLSPGSQVNLERALKAGDRFSGHLVNGHVDGVGTVRSVRREENAVIFEIDMPESLGRYVVEKGSIAVDGMSLTVVEADRDRFTVSVIPHTLGETTLKNATPGTRLNLEVDIIAKYVEALTSAGGSSAATLRDALMEGGFLEDGGPLP